MTAASDKVAVILFAGGARPHFQHYWVRTAEVIATMHREGGLAAVEKVGGNKEIAGRFIKAWRGKASADDAIRWRSAANRPFSSTELEHLKEAVGETKLRQLIAEGRSPEMRTTARAIGVVSQLAHAEQGDKVTLFRGVQGSHAQAIRATAEAGRPVDLATMAGFSESVSTARGYAHGGALVAVRVPVASIMYSWRAFPELHGDVERSEKEVLIATTGRMQLQPKNVLSMSQAERLQAREVTEPKWHDSHKAKAESVSDAYTQGTTPTLFDSMFD